MIIYEPKGKAREYSELAANIYKGCSHACVYCFAPDATFTDRKKFSDPAYIAPRPNIIRQLDKDAEKFAGDPRTILMSFTADVYQPIERDLKLTRQALSVMALNKLTPQILTKAGAWAIERDIDILQKCNGIWAATLTTDNPAESLKWEPGAALPDDRIEALKIAHAAGLKTWVSFEPVFNPDAVYRLIDATHEFVDFYKVGKMNYHPIAKEIDWHTFLINVELALNGYQKPHYIKKDLEAYRTKRAA